MRPLLDALAAAFSGPMLLRVVTAVIACANIALAVLVSVQIHYARKASKEQLRAYVFVEQASATYTTCQFRIKNTGQTPAYKVTLQRIAFLSSPKLTAEPVLSAAPPEACGYIGSGLPISETDITISGPSAGGGDIIYLYGNVVYYDIFGDRHFTKFCSTLQRGPPGQMNIYPLWNEAD